MTEPTSEKVVRLETQMQNHTLQLDRVELKVDKLIIKVDDMVALQNEIDQLKTDIRELKKHRVLFGWLFPTLAAAAGAILALLINVALNK